MNQIPVTVLTGYLGAGKTTLLNRILTEPHGRKYAVVVNEFGEIGIDNDLVVNADEEIFEMNNGCICCTVRGDLIRILGSLMKRRDRFDHILVDALLRGAGDPLGQPMKSPDSIASTQSVPPLSCADHTSSIIAHTATWSSAESCASAEPGSAANSRIAPNLNNARIAMSPLTCSIQYDFWILHPSPWG